MMEANEIATRAPILTLHPASPHENVTQQCLSVCLSVFFVNLILLSFFLALSFSYNLSLLFKAFTGRL